MSRKSKKITVLTELFEICKQRNDFVFHNDLVKDVCRKHGFGNPFDVTKINIQIEIDLTIEFQGTIGIFEAKNGSPSNFAIYQLYHPFLHYHNANQISEIKGEIKNIYGVYVVRNIEHGITNLKMWAYTFENPLDITSIKFVKSACYQLKV